MIELKFSDDLTATSPQGTLRFVHCQHIGGSFFASVIYGGRPARMDEAGEAEPKNIALLFHSESAPTEKEARDKLNDWVTKMIGEYHHLKNPSKQFDS
jgi:hypothetical protein